MAARVKIGDILEVKVDRGLAYLHYLGDDPKYGSGIAVRSRIEAERPSALEQPSFFAGSYVTFYPVAASVKQGLAAIVGHQPSSGLPKVFRRAGGYRNRTTTSWLLPVGPSEQVHSELTDAERLLPMADIWTPGYLVTMLEIGWRPETNHLFEAANEAKRLKEEAVKAAAGLKPIDPTSDPSPTLITHYAYFAGKVEAGKAGSALHSMTLKTEVRRSADDSAWLLLVREELVPAEQTLADAAAAVVRVVEANGGEYDGWEAGE